MKKITVKAKVENLEDVMDFVDSELGEKEVTPRTQMEISISVEELFMNIASYAYASSSEDGEAVVQIDQLPEDPNSLVVTLSDWGTPYNPLEKEDVDVDALAASDKIGGLGIFMVKQNMDNCEYEHKDGQNIIRMVKVLNPDGKTEE